MTLKEPWDELGTGYESSASVIIGDVDCTAEAVLASAVLACPLEDKTGY